MPKFTVQMTKEVEADNLRDAAKKFGQAVLGEFASFVPLVEDLSVHSDVERELVKVNVLNPTHCYDCKHRPDPRFGMCDGMGNVLDNCPECNSPNII